jgi:integrase
VARKRGTGYLFRRKGCQTWTIQFYQEGRKVRERTGTTDRAAAQRLLTKRLYQVNQGELVEPESKPVRVEQLWACMLASTEAEGRSLKDYRIHWKHLQPIFGALQARRITAAMVQQYQQQRKREHPHNRPNETVANRTVNGELGSLLHCLRLGQFTYPSLTVPKVKKLKEDNTRTGFIEDDQFALLAANASELWLRTFLEIGFTYGMRHGEMLGLTVGQVDLRHNLIRLEPGTTKNKDGRNLVMTTKVRQLVEQCMAGRKPADGLFHRSGEPVREVRYAWQTLCVKCGLGRFECRKCKSAATTLNGCDKCGRRKCISYYGTDGRKQGLLVHDLRRSAAKALRLAGVPESTIMRMGGWRTAAMFRRYAIDSHKDQQQAVEMLELARAKNAVASVPARTGTQPNATEPQAQARIN